MISYIFSSFDTYKTWIKTWRSFPIRSWIKAAELYRRGQWAKAAELYRKGLEKHPVHEAAYCARLDLAHCLFKLGQYGESQELHRKIITQLPTLREAYVRLARVQMWVGENLEAAWTMRRALRELKHDGELVGVFTLAILDHGGAGYLFKEAEDAIRNLSDAEKSHRRMQVALARLELSRGDYQKGRANLASLVAGAEAQIDAVVAYGEILLKEGRLPIARQQFRRALLVNPNHPKVLTLMAETYLKSGPLNNPEFAKQLATSACQNSGWSSPEALHVLAEAFKALDDNLSALATAVRAKEAGSKLLSGYRNVKDIDALIETLATAAPDREQLS